MILFQKFFLIVLTYCRYSKSVKIEIETQVDGEQLFQFWDSTGFCPPDPHQSIDKYVLSTDMEQNLALIGSLPNQSLQQVRVHWLLNLVKLNFKNNATEYNFKKLDKFIHKLYVYGLKPGFELMGNPSNYFQNFQSLQELEKWENLIKTLVSRYIKIYGQEYVSKWNFELWNEPDHKKFDGINFTLSSYLEYFKATWKGLQQSGLKNIKLGGPGDKCLPILNDHSQFCWSLLSLTNDSYNNFSLDFISIHEKGQENNLIVILQKEQKVIREIDLKYQNLKKIPIYNNEADPLKIWSESKWWQADSNYASLTAINIIEHIKNYFNSSSKFNQRLKLISHDNAFLSFYPNQFTQRTLLARFQINNTYPTYTQFIQKPIYSVLGLFGLLGNTIIQSKIKENNQSAIRVIATKEKLQLHNESQIIFSVLISNGQPYVKNISFNLNIELKIKHKNAHLGLFRWTRYLIDNLHTNPYQVWKKNFFPNFPSLKLFNKMKKVQGPMPIDSGDAVINQTFCNLNFDLNFPSVSLIIFCSKANKFQEKVTNVKKIYVAKNNILFTWKSIQSKCLKTYQIEYSKSGKKNDFVPINEWKIIFPSFQYTPVNKSVLGYYRIVPIDFWDQIGISSDIIKI